MTISSAGLLRLTHDHVLELRLSRPARRNALTHALVNELATSIHDAMEDDQCRVILLTAEGLGFCAGKDRDDPPTDDFVRSIQTLAARMIQGPKPIIAAVQGWAVGAGFELALGCDLIIAGANARFKLPETQLGLPATGGVHLLLPKIVGISRAKGILWLGQEVSVTQAVQWGMVWEVSDVEVLHQRALELADSLAQLTPFSLARVKRLVNAEHLSDVSAALEREGHPYP